MWENIVSTGEAQSHRRLGVGDQWKTESKYDFSGKNTHTREHETKVYFGNFQLQFRKITLFISCYPCHCSCLIETGGFGRSEERHARKIFRATDRERMWYHCHHSFMFKTN